jgi:phenylacetate-CoA ligase
MRQHIQRDSGIKAYDIYGLSEIIGPGVAMECPCQAGPHIFEDYFYPEVIDAATGKPLSDGEEGELVLTTLSKEAMPMIRYRTHDITAISSEPCECGRTLRRIQRISRRSDDMIIIRGVNVYPSQIETALLKVEGAQPHYQIILTREKGLDEMEVQVEVTADVFSDTMGGLEQLQARLTKSIESATGLRPRVRLIQPHSIQRKM